MCLSFGTNISHRVFSLETLQIDVYVMVVICLCKKMDFILLDVNMYVYVTDF